VARGFESKDVEYQQAEAQRPKTSKAPFTPEARAMVERRRTLELAITRARGDLAMARSAAHKQMLEAAIQALEDQMKGISSTI